MQMGGILNHAILAPTGGSIAYFVNVVANITYAAIRGNNSISKGVSAAVSWASAAPEKDIVKTTITALVDYSASVTKAITITAPFVANISFSNTTLKAISKSISASVDYSVARPLLAIGKSISTAINYTQTQIKAIGKPISAGVSYAVSVTRAVTKDTITASVSYSASVAKALGRAITINMPIGVTYLRKDVGKFFETSISWATAVRLATRFITDLNILQLPVNAVLAHKYLFKKGGDTVEKRDPFYKFERMASRRTGVRRLNRGDGPSFTTKTDKKGYD